MIIEQAHRVQIQRPVERFLKAIMFINALIVEPLMKERMIRWKMLF